LTVTPSLTVGSQPRSNHPRELASFVLKVYRDLVLAKESQDFKVRTSMSEKRHLLAEYAGQKSDVEKLTEEKIKEILVEQGFSVNPQEVAVLYALIHELVTEGHKDRIRL
jgi:hypothetical protein